MELAGKKKIALVVQRYGLEVNGGAELHARVLAERLSSLYDVSVLTTCAIDYVTWKNEYPEGEVNINEVCVHRFTVDQERDPRRFGEIHERVMTYTGSRAEELKWMDEQGPLSTKLIDYIRKVRNDYSVFIFVTYLYYSTFHGLPEVAGKSILIPTAHDEPTIYLSIFKDVFQKPKAIFFNTVSEKRFINRMFNNQNIQSDIGGVGVDLPAKIDSSDFKERFGIKNPYIVYVGRIDVHKGCAELFEMMMEYNRMRVLHDDIPLSLVLIGKSVMDIPESEDIIPLGFVSENDKYAAIKESEFLVLPSLYESLSMVVLEAFCLEKAILVNGSCEVLKDHCILSNGGLYYTSPEEYFACADFLMKNQKIRIQMGKNGRRYQKEYYRWDKIIDKLSVLIENVANPAE